MRKAILLLGIITLATYLNTLSYPFVREDHAAVVNNDYIKDVRNIGKIFSSDFYQSYNEKTGRAQTNYYRPVLSLSYMLDYHLWGLNPKGYRAVNILLHSAIGFLVFLMIFGVSKSIMISLFTSTLFLVHPVQAGAVAYISGRADSLACFFIVGGMILYMAATGFGGGRRRVYYPFSVLAFTLALLTKEVAMLFPFLLVLYDSTYAKKGMLRNPGRYLKRYAPFLVIDAFYIMLRCTVLNFTPGEPLLVDPAAVTSNFLTMAHTMMRYVSILIMPTNLSLAKEITMFRSIHDPGGFLTVLGFASLLFLVVMMLKKRKISFFGALWFLLFILPLSNIVRLNPQIPEQWFYIPSIGFFLMMSVFIIKASEARTFNYQMMVTVFLVLAVCYSVQTVKYSQNWACEKEGDDAAVLLE